MEESNSDLSIIVFRVTWRNRFTIVFIQQYVHEKNTETLDILSPPGDINPKHAVIKTLV